MKAVTRIALALIFTLWGCTHPALETGNGKGDNDPQQGALITLAPIGIGSSAKSIGTPDSRATADPCLPAGSTFRLYAFAKGETDFSKILAVRKYSIVDDAGTPQLMTGENPLYLPVGEIDVYIAGPTEADIDMGDPDYPNKRVEVATESGVFPHIGVDLVSSYTAVTVKDNDENRLTLNVLEHKMALVEVRVTRPDIANYQDFILNWVSIDDQAETGTFQFDTSGGSIIPSDGGTIKLTLQNVREAAAGKEYYTESYMMPRSQTNMRIGMAFQCTLEGRPVEKRLNTSQMNYALPAGVRTRFTAAPLISTELVFRWQLLPWVVKEMEEEEIPTFTGYLFDYNGADAPVEIDGKRYWIDRSGNGMHAELVGDIRYDAQEKCYYQGDPNATILIPKIPYQKNFMIELACRSKKNAAGSMILHSATSSISWGWLVHLPYSDGKVYFDVGYSSSTYNRVNSDKYAKDPRVFENFGTYAFIKSSNEKKQSIYRNGTELASATYSTEPTTGFETNKLLTPDGCMDKKVYAMRMLNAQTTTAGYAALHKQDYRVDMSRFEQMNVTEDPTQRNYIKEGLVLNLSGRDKIKTDGGKFPGIIETTNANSTYTYWPDLSPTQNHMVITQGTMSSNSSSGYWEASSGNLCKLAKPLSVDDEITVEIVATSAATSNTLFNFASKANLGSTIPDGTRQMQLHYYEGGSVVINAGDRIQMPTYTGVSPDDLKTKPNLMTITRKTGDKLTAYINNTQIGQGNAAAKLLPFRHCYIGSNGYTITGTTITPHQSYIGKIYAVRVYNRVLTQAEREYNYEVDKMKYNILP